ncbi:hypothetical protein HPB51_003236 [Rhipicephalus microplus]|uniref:Uncharacterized protein n=1 Tax=Rhipicephalus microplus TaxID=6941 RepID=A0A9J6EQ26_RHIMP|nr:hypothetical protein HPB51_003236 [Rhipicephalus microplus]
MLANRKSSNRQDGVHHCSSLWSASATMTMDRRIIWLDVTTRALMRLWEDKPSTLRSNRCNSRIYARILEELNAGIPYCEGPYNIKQLRLKMYNLGKRYR